MSDKEYQAFSKPAEADVKYFGRALLKWYDPLHRPMPWKAEADPYKIWLSEIILQQTRVEQGLPYYLKFAERYPTVMQLAAAGEDEILKLWEGLGYYSRARNMHRAAKIIAEEYSGRFPEKHADIKALPGIGDYTAAAISAFAYQKPFAVVDGNVLRVLSRYFNFREPSDKSSGKKQLQVLADMVLAKHPPHLYNQAIMDLGAVICKPQLPECDSCPLKGRCYAYAQHAQNKLPLPKKMLSKKKRYFQYLILHNDKQFILKQRMGKDIWRGLHDFPLIETDQILNMESDPGVLLNSLKTAGWEYRKTSEMYVQPLTHQQIHFRFNIFSREGNFPENLPEGWIAVNFSERSKFSMPRTIRKFVESHPYLLDLYESLKVIKNRND